jgi:hypothetical protein
MSSRHRERIIRSLTQNLRCIFSIYYFNTTYNESICVNCSLDEPIISRENYIRRTRHAVIKSNILNLTKCDICSRIITIVRPAIACVCCDNILNDFLYLQNMEELENTYNLANIDPIVIAHE